MTNKTNKPNKEKFFIPKLVTFSVTSAADERADAAKLEPVSRPLLTTPPPPEFDWPPAPVAAVALAPPAALESLE